MYFTKHYAILPLDEATERLNRGTLPQYALAITFDDGYRNFYEHAYPLLKKHRIPATMFLASDFVLDKKPLWVDRLEYVSGLGNGSKSEKIRQDFSIRTELKKLDARERERRLQQTEERAESALRDFSGDRSVYAPLSLEEIREMRGNGIAFGAHTKSHPILSRTLEDAASDEIRGSKEVLEQSIGKISRVFAYPNGQLDDWNEEIERIVGDAGFNSALTTIEGTNGRSTHPMRLKRMALDATDAGPGFAVIVSGVRRWLSKVRNYAN